MSVIFKHKYLLVFITAFVLRSVPFAYVSIYHPEGALTFDGKGYLLLAENIEKYEVFSRSPDESNLISDAIRTPIYPLFLWFLNKINSNIVFILFFQLLIGAVACVLTSYLSRLIFPKIKWSWISGLLLAVDIPSIYISNVIMTEGLFTLLLLSAVIVLVWHIRTSSIPFLILSGFLFGLSILCRPIATFLPLGIAIFLMWKFKPRFVRAGIFLVACYFTVSPWIVRNQLVFGKPFISSIGNINLLLHTAASVKAEAEGLSTAEARNEIYDLLRTEQKWKKNEEAIAPFIEKCNREGLKILKSHPVIFVKQTALSFVYFFVKPMRNSIDLMFGINKYWHDPIMGLAEKETGQSKFEQFKNNTSSLTIALVIIQLLMILVTGALALFAIYTNLKTSTFWIVMLVAIILYFGVTSSITEVEGRMRIPVLPFWYMLSALGVGLRKGIKFNKVPHIKHG